MSKVKTIRFSNNIKVIFFPINLNNMAIDEIHTADEVSEKTMAAPSVRSV